MRYFVELDNGYRHLPPGMLCPIDDQNRIRDFGGEYSDLRILHGDEFLTILVDL